MEQVKCRYRVGFLVGRAGVICIRRGKTNKGKEKEFVTVSAYEKQESEQKSTPKVGGIAMAAAGALGAGQAGAAIVSAIGGPLTSFKRNYYCFQ